jgi:hypothetical protein
MMQKKFSFDQTREMKIMQILQTTIRTDASRKSSNNFKLQYPPQ